MRINGISGTNTQARQMGISHASDSYSKNIKNQIAGAQEKLKELSSNTEMSLEEKMKKRQEIQKQITELNQQLRQHEIEQRRQQRQEESASAEDTSSSNVKTRAAKSGKKARGLSQAGMKAIISAGSAMDQVQAGQQVTTRIEGQANVLKAEINQDKQAGLDTQAKEEDLAGLEENLTKAQASQMELLGKAGEEMKEASKVEEETDKRVEKKTETSKTEEAAGQDSKALSQAVSSYKHVDIQL